jgi:hypothetical protein
MKLYNILFETANLEVRTIIDNLNRNDPKDRKLKRWVEKYIITPHGNLRSEEKLVDAFAGADNDIKSNSQFAELRKAVLSQALYFNRDRYKKLEPKGAIEQSIQQAVEKEIESISPRDPCDPATIEKFVLQLPRNAQNAARKRLIAKHCGEQPENETSWDTFKRVMTTDVGDLVDNYKANRAKRLGEI